MPEDKWKMFQKKKGAVKGERTRGRAGLPVSKAAVARSKQKED